MHLWGFVWPSGEILREFSTFYFGKNSRILIRCMTRKTLIAAHMKKSLWFHRTPEQLAVYSSHPCCVSVSLNPSSLNVCWLCISATSWPVLLASFPVSACNKPLSYTVHCFPTEECPSRNTPQTRCFRHWEGPGNNHRTSWKFEDSLDW